MKIFLLIVPCLLALSSCGLFADYTHTHEVENEYELLIHWDDVNEQTVTVDVSELQSDLFLVDNPLVEGMYFVGCYTRPEGEGKQLINYFGNYILANKEPDYKTDECYAYYLPLEDVELTGLDEDNSRDSVGKTESGAAEFLASVRDLFAGADYYQMAQFWDYSPEAVDFYISGTLLKSQMTTASGIKISVGFRTPYEDTFESGDSKTISLGSPSDVHFQLPGEDLKYHYLNKNLISARFSLVDAGPFANCDMQNICFEMNLRMEK